MALIKKSLDRSEALRSSVLQNYLLPGSGEMPKTQT